MKAMLLSLLLTILTITPAWAWQDWSKSDQQMFVASSIAITADWMTTRWAADNNWPNGTWEKNYVMGRHPSVDTVDTYFVVMLISNYIIADALPERYRSFYFTFRTVTHGSAALGNVELGWRMRF
jgi:hypothetical protein